MEQFWFGTEKKGGCMPISPDWDIFWDIPGFLQKKTLRKNPDISSEDIMGKDGLEEKYEETLRGISGIKLTERDSGGNPVSESVQVVPQNGQNLTLTVDSRSPVSPLLGHRISRERKEF